MTEGKGSNFKFNRNRYLEISTRKFFLEKLSNSPSTSSHFDSGLNIRIALEVFDNLTVIIFGQIGKIAPTLTECFQYFTNTISTVENSLKKYLQMLQIF